MIKRYLNLVVKNLKNVHEPIKFINTDFYISKGYSYWIASTILIPAALRPGNMAAN